MRKSWRKRKGRAEKLKEVGIRVVEPDRPEEELREELGEVPEEPVETK